MFLIFKLRVLEAPRRGEIYVGLPI